MEFGKTEVVNEVVGVLHNLFEKKKFFEEEYSTEEMEFIGRFKNSRLVRALIDPDIEFKFDEGFVPPKIELELAYSVVSSRTTTEGVKLKDMVRVVKNALTCANDLRVLLGA